MAATTSSVYRHDLALSDQPICLAKGLRRRSIDPQSGHALVILGHAIEYLTDEFIAEGGSFAANRGPVDAIQLLMALNREIYFSCPERPTFGQWLRSSLRRMQEKTRTKRTNAGSF